MVVSFVEEFLAGIWASTPKHLIFEVALIVAIFLLLTQKPREIIKNDDELTTAEEDAIIAQWTPKPIVPELPDDYDPSVLDPKVIFSAPTDKITVEGKEALNFAVPNFFGLNNNKELLDAAQKAIDHYAVGACGPRQFYGTMDAHLDVEEAIAKWTGVEDSVNYCFPFATTTSVIQAFAHNTDVVFIDEYCWFAIKVGSELTRGKVVVYKHNDMGDLRDKIIKTKNSFERWEKCNRWVVAEGISTNDGTIVDLPAIIKLRHEFCLRIILDETNSFGALGKTGRGACEHFDIDRSEVEISIGSYGTALASLGGFTISTKELCAHQRLSSHAYIFSASPPPYAVICARRAVEIVQKDGAERIAKLRENIQLMRNELHDVQGLEIISDAISPIVHLKLGKETGYKEANTLLQKVCDEALNDASAPTFIVKSKFALNRDANKERPTIKIYVAPIHTEEEIKNAAAAIKRAAQKILA
ncbi:serine palmitoyl transferase subunit, putative [Trichomonas vaginalis G3]|uniref:serine C-palmitoyltransferase n=1 Tax=Trichomonas vaginalis (strain ATCC PRA-98 / G3) TaxID=412133 RepID=A2D9P8_TRIV3|nr:class II aminotransferase/8-amino-7-oxononanoate synthase family [Trichomonas vaginalis G3]EAY22904.1 serine palmitoyl transferase subunit, putative [Trichomonas vaginalis G3]KAI5527370.1 class II aminotransferase/8-amino-7-oxononanoate synthase family [Trichomonas vaginalis G3]|eukprot:XP_001583890.1 serine palmitoyl transferase subunit [Trichomonas vaginalis G3]